MSFYTSLTGLNGAQADIAAISNNIANVGTTGFKRSRAEFGDIFATSPLQAASSAIGSGTILKSIKQQFTQGNIESSLNALDLAISGQGFFALKPSLTSTQTVYTRNGAFSVNNDRYVVDAQGQLLQVFPVNADGSVIATGINSAKNLQLPTTSGLPKASETIQLGLNLPADAEIIPSSSTYNSNNPYVFDKTNPATYNKSTSITIYDSLGNSTIATIYYVKTSNATEASPTNKWQTYVFVGDREVTPQLISAKDDQSRTYYINKFGQITTDPQAVDPTFNAAAPHPLYKQDDQTNKTESTAASVVGGIMRASGFDFGDTDATKVTIVTDPALFNTTRESGTPAASGANPPYWGVDMFSISVDGSAVQSISINAGTYTGTQLAAELTRAVNARFGGAHYFSITDTYRKENGAVISGNDIIQLNLSRLAEDGGSVPMTTPLEIDLLGSGSSTGTPPSGSNPAPETKLQITREELVKLAQTKLNDELNRRHLEFGKPSTWPSADNPPIVVGYDVASRAFTFTVSPTQLGPDANEPSSRFNSIQVYNPTDTLNDLGIPPKTTSSDVLIRTNTLWTGSAALPGGDFIVDPREQRTGIEVTYNKDTRQFAFHSGSTGEASAITVGRAQLATSADVQAQVDSFNLETMDFSTDKKITMEVNGRQLVYNYSATITPKTMNNGTAVDAEVNSSTDNIRFFQGMEQAIPVTFDDEKKVTPGSSTVKEVQSFMAYGKIMAGDEFKLNIAPAPGATAQTITVGPLGLGDIPEGSLVGEPDKIDKDTSVGSQLRQLKNAINKALVAKGFQTATTGVVCDSDSNQFTLSYKTYGAVATIATLKQSVRGSNALDTRNPPIFGANSYIKLTDATIVPSTPKILDGTTTTQTEQRITLTKTDGLAPVFAAGDVFRITIPMADGTEAVDDITITPLPAVNNVTPSLLDCLVAAANASSKLTNVTFSRADTGNTLIATWKNNGHITGAMSIEQVGKGNADETVALSGVSSVEQVSLTGVATNLDDATDPTSINKMLTVASTTGLYVGMEITGANIPAGATIVAINSTTEIEISNTPTAAITAGTSYTAEMPNPTLTMATTTGLQPGMVLTGVDIPSGTIVTAVLSDTEVEISLAPTNPITSGTGYAASTTNPMNLTAVATTTPISDTLLVASTDYLKPGMAIAGTNIPPGTTIVAIISSTRIVISSTPTGAIAAGTANAYSTTKVRPENIGPFSVKGNAPVLEFSGDPTGKPFRLNLRVDGVVRAKEPVGAQGSTSLNALQIGAAKVLNFSGSNDLLGVGDKYSAQQIFVAGTGLTSSPAQAVGARGVTPMNQTFMLNENLGENRMTFTVDGIVGTITLPIRAYTGDTFASAIQDRVNQIQDPVTGRIVSGVTVKFEPDHNRLVFTSGTAGSSSQINVVGHPNFGLAKVTQTAGSIPIITNLKQATDEQGNKLYVDTQGNISTQQPSALQNWYPLYLQEGQLTFDTIGKLISPKEGVIYSPFDPQNGSDLLRLNIDYGKFSTQFSSPFSVLSLSQDGYPSGSLNGLDIDASGTIRANYTNGQTTALGKVMVANFANANGLKQIGNANYVATSVSGQVVLGQAGADGFGTIKAGALERSNVDITEELVNLITAQRNFQANAKAIETTTTLSQTIIQIRG